MRARELFLLGLAGCLLCLPFPAARAAARRTPRSAAPSTPVERALTGGLVTLRAPLSRMVRFGAGSFVMGSTRDEVLAAVQSCRGEPLAYLCSESHFSNELPRHVARTGAFYLDRTEVSVEEYEHCVKAGVCNTRVLEQGARRLSQPKLPVTFVSADDAETYCRFRGARLPTESEFERAARGSDGRRFPWGNLYHSRRANHGRLGLQTTDASDGYAELAPVGSFPSGQTATGVLDLAGNAAEWTASPYTERHGEPVDPSWGGARVVRGGHFQNAEPSLRGAARSQLAPGQIRVFVGFRCARSAELP